MLPDSFNPIFALKVEQTIRLIRKTWLYIIGVYAFFVLFFCLTSDFVGNDLSFFAGFMFYSYLHLMAAIVGIIPGVELARKRITDDLFLFTPMLDRQIVNGYILTGILYSFFSLVLVGLPFQVFFIYQGQNPFLAIGSFLLVFLGSIIVNLYFMSFVSGVRTMTALVTTGLLMYFFYLNILSGFLAVGAIPYMEKTEKQNIFPLSLILYLIVCLPSLAFTAYQLAVLNYSWKKPIAIKHAFFIGTYLILLGGMVLLMFLLNYWIG